MKRILCALCISLVGLQALAGEVDESLKKLDAALQKTPKEQGKQTEDSEDSPSLRRANLFSILPALRANIDRNDLNSAMQMLQQIVASPSISDDAKKAGLELLSALNKEQNNRDKAVTEKIDQALKHATEAVKTAKAAAELDAVLQELTSVKNLPQNQRYSEGMQTNRNKVESTYRFVARWQDYLVAQAAGNDESCRNILRDLANSETLLMPRSELLAKAQEPLRPAAEPTKVERPIDEIADELILKTKNLNDVGGLIKELKLLNERRRSGDNNRSYLFTCIGLLGQIDRNYREFEAGLATNIDIATDPNSTPASIVPLKTQLTLHLLPRYIGAPADTKPKTGERVVDFLSRVEAEAKARGNIGLAIRSRETLFQMQRNIPWSHNDSQALSAYQSAQNQEIAGQYMLAVISYQTALKSGGDTVPSKLIGERLAEIKKNHPEDFEKGTERFLNPPPPCYNPMMRYPMGMPGMPGATPTPTPEPPKLVIPPPTPAPSAAAATPASSPNPAK